MRLRRKAPALSEGRRRRQDDGPSKASPAFAYRSRRTDQDVNVGRNVPRESGGNASSKSLGSFLLRRFGLVVLLIALMASAINVASLSSDARVVTLSGAGSNPFLQDKSAYQEAASRYLAGSAWNRNKLTVDTGGLSDHMLKEFPELSSVSVTLPLLSKRPTVYVQTSEPALVLEASNGAFVIANSGKALLNAGNLSAPSRHKLPTVDDQSNLGATLNKQVLSSVDVSFIMTVVAELSARHIGVASMTLPPGASELDVRISGQPYTVKFNLESGDARQQAGTFLATQSQLTKQHITPSQYIDVRVDGRAYYK